MFYALPAETVFEAKERTRRATFYLFILLVFLYVFFIDLMVAAVCLAANLGSMGRICATRRVRNAPCLRYGGDSLFQRPALERPFWPWPISPSCGTNPWTICWRKFRLGPRMKKTGTTSPSSISSRKPRRPRASRASVPWSWPIPAATLFPSRTGGGAPPSASPKDCFPN